MRVDLPLGRVGFSTPCVPRPCRAFFAAFGAFRPVSHLPSTPDVYGTLERHDDLTTFGTAPIRLVRSIGKLLGRKSTTEVKILDLFEGFVNNGAMLAVLGRLGSGSTALSKPSARETRDLRLGHNSKIKY
jgi:hypothetical protein